MKQLLEKWKSQLGILELVAIAVLIASVVWVIVGSTYFFDPQDYYLNLWTEFAGVLLGGVFVAFLFDGLAKAHRRQRWQQVRGSVLKSMSNELSYIADDLRPDWQLGVDYGAEADWLSSLITTDDEGIVVPLEETDIDEDTFATLDVYLERVDQMMPKLIRFSQRHIDRLIFSESGPGLVDLLVDLDAAAVKYLNYMPDEPKDDLDRIFYLQNLFVLMAFVDEQINAIEVG